MPQIFNALDLKNGAKVETGHKIGAFTQPIQFLARKDKNEAWANSNLDWLELQGIKQLRRNARRLLKNYKLANGIIDKTDYVLEEDNIHEDSKYWYLTELAAKCTAKRMVPDYISEKKMLERKREKIKE